MRPEAAHAALVRRADDGIVLGRAVLPATHRAAVALEPHLPEGRVAREERRVAAAADEALDGVAHLPRPVLVVADAQVEPIGVERVGPRVEVDAREIVEPMAGALGPCDEAALPVEPAGCAAPRIDAVRDEVVEPPAHVGVARIRHVRETIVRRLRPIEEPFWQRPIERDDRRRHVEVRPAPVVVRAPRRRREREHHLRVAARMRGAYDEVRLARRNRGIDAERAEDDLVVTRPPGAIDGDREGRRPAAAVRRDVVGHGMVVDRDTLAPEHDLAPRAHARDLDRDIRNARRAVKADRLAGDDALRPRVAFDDGVDDRRSTHANTGAFHASPNAISSSGRRASFFGKPFAGIRAG